MCGVGTFTNYPHGTFAEYLCARIASLIWGRSATLSCEILVEGEV
jgi:hypothetical protein